MRKIRVHILTTAGPVEVQSLVAEDAPIPSVVCLDGTTRPLPISEDYAHFVKRGTGVIERLTGHHAYRLDVAAEITGGLSWQLGVFTAHVLHQAGELAQRGEAATHDLFITGEIDSLYGVRPVQHVAEKIRAAMDTLRVAAQPQIWMPTENAPTVTALGLPAEVIGHGADVFQQLGLPLPEEISPPTPAGQQASAFPVAGQQTFATAKSRVWPVALSVVFLSTLAGAAFLARDHLTADSTVEVKADTETEVGTTAVTAPLTDVSEVVTEKLVRVVPAPDLEPVPEPNTEPETTAELGPEPKTEAEVLPEPVPPPLPRPDVAETVLAALPPQTAITSSVEIEVWEQRPPRGSSCVDVRFDQAEDIEIAVPRFNDILGASSLENLCGLRFHVESPEIGRHVFAFLNVSPRQAPYLVEPWREINNQTFELGVVEWESEIPPRGLPAVSYDIVALEAETRITPPQLLAVRNFMRRGTDPRAASFTNEMAQFGIAVTVTSHQLN